MDEQGTRAAFTAAPKLLGVGAKAPPCKWAAVRWNQTAVRQYEQGSRAAITAALILLGITASSLRVTVAARATSELLRGSLRLRPNS